MKTLANTMATTENKIEFLGKKWNIILDRYQAGNALAVLLVGKTDQNSNVEETIVLTTNIEDGMFILGDNCSHLDTNNLGHEVIELIEKYHLGFDVDCSASSGICVYPQYAFNIEDCAKYFKKAA